MEIFEKKYYEPFYQSNILNAYLDGCTFAAVDIETTGLSPERNRVIIGGILIIEPDGFTIRQYFAEDKSEEAELLKSFCEELKQTDIIINYNGSVFDIPFLNKRMAYHKIAYEIPFHQSFDLYKILKNSGCQLGLQNYRQKTVEKFLGIARTDEITGKESIELYNRFLKTRSESIKKIILNHNSEDLYCLAKLMKILSLLDIHKIMFQSGFYVKSGNKKISFCKIIPGKKNIRVCGKLSGISIDYAAYAAGYTARTNCGTNDLFIQIPFVRQNSVISIDLSDFDFDLSCLLQREDIRNNMIIIQNDNNINYAGINLLIKCIGTHLLNSF